MQPDQTENPVNNDPGSDAPTEMYTPSSTAADSEVVPARPPETKDVPRPVPDNEPVHWSANETIDADKNGLWFVALIIVALALIAGDIFLLKEFTFSILVVVMAAVIILYSRRPARLVDYTLSGDQGLYVGERLYHFSEFKAFGLIQDRGQHSILLIPVKRFATGVSVYFPEEAGEKIVDIFGARLPMKDLKLDMIDVIVRKLQL
ncbi:MAG TPA: hypothetical protein VMR16_02885 [Candidatus Saccharimonadales bacterium]|nr:hypothetical protein [Candidatus Saccharimonadales bacterium]